jgi:hypothetical protein
MANSSSRLSKLNFKPGFHRESTQYSEEGKWYDGDRVRFREGKPENLRGYQKHYPTRSCRYVKRFNFLDFK